MATFAEKAWQLKDLTKSAVFVAADNDEGDEDDEEDEDEDDEEDEEDEDEEAYDEDGSEMGAHLPVSFLMSYWVNTMLACCADAAAIVILSQ